jgi:hypothetical protein
VPAALTAKVRDGSGKVLKAAATFVQKVVE